MNGQKCGNLSTPEIPKAETGPEKFPNLLLSTLLEHMISLIKCFFQTEGRAGQGYRADLRYARLGLFSGSVKF